MAVRVWVILSEILKTVKLSRESDHDLSTYIVLMEQTFDNCMSAMIDEASNNDDMKKIKIPQVEENRGYCQDGAKKPKHPYHTCPKCQAPFVHEPPETVAIREGNKVKTKAWKNLNRMLEQFNAGLINNPPTDANGKPYTKQIELKLGEVTYYCKAYKMKHKHGEEDVFQFHPVQSQHYSYCKPPRRIRQEGGTNSPSRLILPHFGGH